MSEEGGVGGARRQRLGRAGRIGPTEDEIADPGAGGIASLGRTKFPAPTARQTGCGRGRLGR